MLQGSHMVHALMLQMNHHHRFHQDYCNSVNAILYLCSEIITYNVACLKASTDYYKFMNVFAFLTAIPYP